MTTTHYDIILELLHEHGYAAGRVVLVKSSGSRCIGVEILSNPIVSGGEVEKIKSLVGDGYLVDYLPNSMEILIRTKEDNGLF